MAGATHELFFDSKLLGLCKGLMWFIFFNLRGFYPKGGGEVHVQTHAANVLKPIEMTDFGHVVKIYGTSYVAGVLPCKVSVMCKY